MDEDIAEPDAKKVKQNQEKSTIAIPAIIILEENIALPDHFLKELQTVYPPKFVLAKKESSHETVTFYIHIFKYRNSLKDGNIRYRVVSRSSSRIGLDYKEEVTIVHNEMLKDIENGKKSITQRILVHRGSEYDDLTNDPYIVQGYDDKKTIDLHYIHIESTEQKEVQPILDPNEPGLLPFEMNEDGSALIMQPDGSYRTLEPGEVFEYQPDVVDEAKKHEPAMKVFNENYELVEILDD